jgi:ribosomal protein S18 acetylase RimI-like enzyme
MVLREAVPADVEGIRHAARKSLAASYGHALDEDLIDEAVEEWYGDDLADRLDEESSLYLVAAEDDELVGFSQSHLVGESETYTVGEIAWLHVDPDRRGGGHGTRLLERTERELVDRGASQFRGRVLAANEPGAGFYRDHGYEEADGREVEIGEETFDERTFVKWPAGEEAGRELPLEQRETPTGRSVYVAYGESERASEAPMYAVYADENSERLYGWLCGNCESFDVGMDSMGRMECNDCGNWRKPTRWDASYL